jgi:uncharacterized DUF497 family protein
MDDIMFTVGMVVEFDNDKAEINLEKHRYSLECAQDVINSITLFGNERFIVSDPFYENNEVRYMLLAEYNGDIIHIAFTWRDKTMRVISLRTASKKERKTFEDELG